MSNATTEPRSPEAHAAWAPIPGFPGYLASTEGRLFSVRYGRVMADYIGDKGYIVTSMVRGGARCTRLVHRMVALAHLGIPAAHMQCRHLDGDRTNPRLGNLLWGTVKENSADADLHGTLPKGERHANSIIKEDQVREIRKGGHTMRYFAEKFGVDKSTIQHIARHRNWRSVQ